MQTRERYLLTKNQLKSKLFFLRSANYQGIKGVDTLQKQRWH